MANNILNNYGKWLNGIDNRDDFDIPSAVLTAEKFINFCQSEGRNLDMKEAIGFSLVGAFTSAPDTDMVAMVLYLSMFLVWFISYRTQNPEQFSEQMAIQQIQIHAARRRVNHIIDTYEDLIQANIVKGE